MKLLVISMSGGLDSTTLAIRALEKGFTILPINIKYKQKHMVEIEAFKDIISYLNSRYKDRVYEPISIDIEPLFDNIVDIYSSMRDSGIIKKRTDLEYYTPSRNLLFSVISTFIGETIAYFKDIDSVYIGLGIHKHKEYRNYWDITPEFAQKLQELLSLNDNIDIKLYTPYVDKYKKDIIEDVIKYSVPYKLTWTCYNPIKRDNTFYPCLECEACHERESMSPITDINQYSKVL